MIELLASLLQNQVFIGIGGSMLMGMAMYLLRAAPVLAWRYGLALFSVTVEVRNTDATFYWLVRWLGEHPYSKSARRLRLSLADGDAPQPTLMATEVGRPKWILSPGDGFHFFFVDGIPITLQREKGASNGANNYREMEIITLRTFARGRKTLTDILTAAYQLTNEVNDKKLVVHMFSYDHWFEACRQPIRPFESVVLADGLGESIAADMERFLVSEAWYTERGIPYRRGYLFHGPPGCGKSSLAAVIATRLGMDISMLSLAALGSDESMQRALQKVPPNTILLIEDVDAAFREREASKGTTVTFSAFLNAIDGVAAPSGRILIITTNHRDKLDPAIIRPGRVDREVLFSPATAEQATNMFLRFFPSSPSQATQFGKYAAGLTPAKLQETLIVHAESSLGILETLSKDRQ